MLSSDDYPPRFQRTWAFRTGDQLELTVYLEANTSERREPSLITRFLSNSSRGHNQGFQ
jgi:hypothetical protein